MALPMSSKKVVSKKIPDVLFGGKTGTAENPHGQDHGWFIAYAPAEKPDLAIACIVEQGSYGATASGPIVYEVLEKYLTDKLKKASLN